MKRKVITMLCVCAALFAAGCSSAPNAPDTGNSRENTEAADVSGNDTGEPPAVPVESGKILVAYFSWADNAVLEDDVDAVSSPSVIPPGNVQQLAGWVQEETGGDLFTIRVTDPYPSDWDECLERANEEKSENARPEMEERVENLEKYDTVFLGYPKIQYGFLSV